VCEDSARKGRNVSGNLFHIFFVSWTGMKIPTQVWKFLPRYENSYPGMKIPTQVWKFLLRYENFYPALKLYTWVWNFLSGYETPNKEWNFPIMLKIATWVRSFPIMCVWKSLPGYEIFQLCANLIARNLL
jgi:hypothetical protein